MNLDELLGETSKLSNDKCRELNIINNEIEKIENILSKSPLDDFFLLVKEDDKTQYYIGFQKKRILVRIWDQFRIDGSLNPFRECKSHIRLMLRPYIEKFIEAYNRELGAR